MGHPKDTLVRNKVHSSGKTLPHCHKHCHKQINCSATLLLQLLLLLLECLILSLPQEDSLSLVVSNVTSSDGEGYFSCEVKTEYASDRAYIRLNVVEKPEITTISTGPLYLFSSLNLTCVATGDPVPTVTWVTPDNNSRGSGSSVTVEQPGVFTCNVSNSVGWVTR